ncbi:MAG: hypothetical protein U0836_04290 [Pirellulales bacterium]
MRTSTRALCLLLLTVCAGGLPTVPSIADEATRPLEYRTTWLGNTFGGGPKWVQNFAEDLVVRPDGTCIVGSFWDEAGHEVGLYQDGQPVGALEHTHMRAGKAVAAHADYIYYANTCVREDQPGVAAGEARRDKPICYFGVSRWTRDGKPAPFSGGRTPYGNMLVFREAPDNHDLIARGLAVDAERLYVADTLENRIRAFDTATLAPRFEIEAERPERLALDAARNLWVVHSGGKRISSFTREGKPREIAVPLPVDSVASSLSFAPDGRMLVADNGPGQQILFFDVRSSPAKLVESFGEAGGMFGGPDPGHAGPLRFAGPTGAGFDAAGNLYVSCNLPRGGTVLRAFGSRRELLWELLGLEFVDVPDASPESDGADVFSADERYTFDPAAAAGRGWKWVAHTLDPHRYPDDLRLHMGIMQCATSVRRLEGKTFLCQRGMWQGVLGIYRIDGDLAIPAAVLTNGPLREENGNWRAAGQPESGRFFWRDANGNGRFDAGEYTPTTGPEGEYWASNVDARGDIWQAGRESGIWRWRFLGLDEHGNPQHDPKPEHHPMPAPLSDLLRTEYVPETDTMYLTGQTADRPISGGEWGTAGTVVVRYDEWTRSPKLRYRVDLPYVAEKTFMVSFHVAGDLFFAVDCKSAEVLVYDNRNGALLGAMKPGPEVQRESGWVDFRDALRATRRANGDYLVFVEEDYKAKALVYLLRDPLRGDPETSKP